ncbi:hypothetical protein B0T17DRAFT_527377 [Bombardia bombarda]|uniref:Uncharacterized protein n=1 Tax=Bombardia bombarda TaxID=252184 RepID=A0AA39X9X7_9PEZI|nr:hypothetical protein B0T17DRAFT_527377 [Bombardia bombarda]
MAGYDGDGDVTVDKQWAANYILGPLHDLEPSQVCATRIKSLASSAVSKSLPTTGSPFVRKRHSRTSSSDTVEDQARLRRILLESNSFSTKPRPHSPLRPKYPPITRWNQGTILTRSSSVVSSRLPKNPVGTTEDKGTRRTTSLAERYPGDRSHQPPVTYSQEIMAQEGGGIRRSASLRERYPGDMSHRPLAMIQRERRAADRAPYLHTRHHKQPSDVIDALDHSGPVPETAYHHEGPFDATMQSRNTDKKYSPVEAVKSTNMEALKATPAEYLKDSLSKHVPLQGTAVIPPGMLDMSGRPMEYQEGADMMRERDAGGGAYKRWDHVPYRDDDYKGKGEPSFTIERDHREQKARMRKHAPSSSANGITSYEMRQPSTSTGGRGRGKENGTSVRQRSVSNAMEGSSAYPLPESNPFSDHYSTGNQQGVQRSHSTGKNIAQTLKRRFGSLRRKKAPEEEDMY